jgi:hypothetical protein
MTSDQWIVLAIYLSPSAVLLAFALWGGGHD